MYAFEQENYDQRKTCDTCQLKGKMENRNLFWPFLQAVKRLF